MVCRTLLTNAKKIEKNFKKGVDKWEVFWYNNKAVAENRKKETAKRSLKIEQQE